MPSALSQPASPRQAAKNFRNCQTASTPQQPGITGSLRKWQP